jgi:hypothetical protein
LICSLWLWQFYGGTDDRAGRASRHPFLWKICSHFGLFTCQKDIFYGIQIGLSIATWCSPLPAYVYFRDEDEKNVYTTLKSLEGSRSLTIPGIYGYIKTI